MEDFSKFTLRVLFALLFCAILPNVHAQIGGLDTRFNPSLDGAVNAVAVQSDGKVVIAGDFTSVNGTPRSRIARLNPDGSLDSGFAASLTGANATVWCMALQSDGKIIVGGEFSTINDTGRNRIARLNSDGTLDTSFNPGTGTNATVFAVATYPRANEVVIGGDFTTVNGTTRNRIAQLQSNGSLDTSAFAGSGANGSVYTIVTGDKEVYFGGAFTSVDGVARNRLARFGYDHGTRLELDPSFNSDSAAGPNGTVYSIAPLSNSSFSASLLIGGDFTAVGGTARSRFALVDVSTSAADPACNISVDGTVRCLFIPPEASYDSPTVNIVIGGDFSSIDGTARNRVARITRKRNFDFPRTITWNLDTNYNTGSGANASVRCVATQSDGKTLIGGQFTSIDGNSRSGFARLYGNGGSVPPEAPEKPASGVGSDTQLVLVWSGVSYTSGYRIERSLDGVNGWAHVNPATSSSPANPYIDAGLSPGTTYFYRIIAFSTNGDSLPSPVASATTLPVPWTKAGAPDLSFIANTGSGAEGWAYAVAPQPDGKIYIGGFFSSYDGRSYKGIVRLHSDGSLDSTFDTISGPNGPVYAIAVQSNGRVIIGGGFTSVGGVARNFIARLNADGSLDTTFAPSSGASWSIQAVAIQPNGQILIAGNFFTVNGEPRTGLARLNADGSLDTSFNPNLPFGSGSSLALQLDGKILVAGSFQSVNGTACGNIARLHSDGTLDMSFAQGTGANLSIGSMQLQDDGRIVIAGAFDRYNGVVREGVARLFADGSLDPTFDPGPNGGGGAVAVQKDGKVVLGGWFETVGETARVHLARLNADGTLDSSFVPGLGADSPVEALGIQPDGKCIAVGLFKTMNGVASNHITRLLADNGTHAPESPQNPSATVLSSRSIRLSWPSVAFVSGYKVFKSADGISGWNQVSTLPADATSFTLLGLTNGTSASFRIRAYNTNGESTDSAIVSATTYSPYEQWKLDNGLPATAHDLADSDGDGIPNLLEYALGSHPRIPDPNNMPVVSASGSKLTFTYSKLRTDIEYAVEVSTDLVSWTTKGVDQGNAGPLVTASTSLEAEGSKFLRLRISTPDAQE